MEKESIPTGEFISKAYLDYDDNLILNLRNGGTIKLRVYSGSSFIFPEHFDFNSFNDVNWKNVERVNCYERYELKHGLIVSFQLMKVTKEPQYSFYFYFVTFSHDTRRDYIIIKYNDSEYQMPDSNCEEGDYNILKRFSKNWLKKWFQQGIKDHCQDSDSEC